MGASMGLYCLWGLSGMIDHVHRDCSPSRMTDNLEEAHLLPSSTLRGLPTSAHLIEGSEAVSPFSMSSSPFDVKGSSMVAYSVTLVLESFISIATRLSERW